MVQETPDFSNIQTWLFDLDNTLYSAKDQLFLQMGRRITEYVMQLLALEYEAARQIQKKYYRTYGTTLRGLMTHHNIDPHNYLDFVHDLDASILPIDTDLQKGLSQISGRKIIFTNASVGHAENILSHLGIRSHFEDIFDIVAADFIPKPDMAPYEKIIQRYQLDPGKSIMVEDLSINLVPARQLGMKTALIQEIEDISYQTAQIDGQSIAGPTPLSSQESAHAHVQYHVQNLGQWLQEVSGVSN